MNGQRQSCVFSGHPNQFGVVTLQHCRRCCTSDKCNAEAVQANVAAVVASVTLLVTMVFVAMVMPDQRCRV